MGREAITLEYIWRQRAGLGTDFSVPESTVYLRPSVFDSPATAGPADTPPESDSPFGRDYPEEDFVPVAVSNGVRRPPARSRGSARGSHPHAASGREYVTESGIEERALACLLADPETVRVRDQWPEVRFRDQSGKETRHVFDFTVYRKSGPPEAIAVRPRGSGTIKELRADIACINAQGCLDGLAGQARVVTDAMVPYWMAWNAEQLLRYSEVRHVPDVHEAARHALGLGESAVFGDLMRGAEVEAWRRAAAWWLVREGAVVPRKRGRLKDWVPVAIDRERIEAVLLEAAE